MQKAPSLELFVFRILSFWSYTPVPILLSVSIPDRCRGHVFFLSLLLSFSSYALCLFRMR